MQPSAAQLQVAIAALERVLALDHPADAALRGFFAERRQLGSHDRAYIAETVFAVLRHKRLLEQLVGQRTPRRLALAVLIKLQGYGIGQLDQLLGNDDKDWAVRLKSTDIELLPAATRLSLPDWLHEDLLAQYPEPEVVSLARAMLRPAPLDLRVNTLKISRDDALRALQAGGLNAEATPYSPVGIRLAGKPAINRHPLFLDGAIEVQDEGSQLLGFLLAPKRREMVVDFCAGAGGKTLMLGALMQSRGRLYALDVSEKRLNNFKPRLQRSGLSNVHPQLIQSETDVKVRRLAGKIDRVLVDAPCSGLGTLRRNPDLKWRQSPETVAELTVKQSAILNAAATLVKPGGRLVYATCSLLANENRRIVERFLEKHPEFSVVSSEEILDEQRISVDCKTFLQLRPDLHNTDAFFAAAMQRRQA
jgi:16S rRNA (cytosine967-C5)-methyltransferase